MNDGPLSDEFDLSDSLDWEDGLPRPRWDLVEAWAESRLDATTRRDAWTTAGRQWLTELGTALGRRYEPVESDNFLALCCRADATGGPLLRFAERCRARLLSTLNGVADFEGRGRQLVLALRNPDDYYRYVSLYYPGGEHGGSVGLHIRAGYPHIALQGRQLPLLENTLAHELTHAALHHLTMPQWVEEGLAQMVEHDITGRSLLEVNAGMAARHKRYWGKYGLDSFWRGEGFARAGKVQELSYQLAEILMRLLIEEGRPRWFGLVREPQQRLFAFLQAASATDCGEEACRKHLGIGLSDVAAKFLGPGDWSPSL